METLETKQELSLRDQKAPDLICLITPDWYCAQQILKDVHPEQNRGRKALKKQVKEFAIANGLDWGVIKKETYFEWEGEKIPTGDFALVHSRTMSTLNTVKDGYNVSQNLHIIQLVLMGVKGFGDKLKVTRAGSLNGGKRVFIQIEIIGDSFIGDERVKKYITIVDSNDGSSSLSVGIGDEFASCDNQFFYFSRKGDVKFRHTASLAEKMKTIPVLIEFALSKSMRMIELYKEFQSTPITRELAHDMVRKQLGYNRLSKPEDLNELSARSLKNMNTLYEDIYGEMDGDELNGNQPKGENLLGLLAGVTRWTTHHKQAPRRDNGRLESIMIGNNYKANAKALNFVLEEAGLTF